MFPNPIPIHNRAFGIRWYMIKIENPSDVELNDNLEVIPMWALNFVLCHIIHKSILKIKIIVSQLYILCIIFVTWNNMMKNQLL
jgi:hypothetical protein